MTLTKTSFSFKLVDGSLLELTKSLRCMLNLLKISITIEAWFLLFFQSCTVMQNIVSWVSDWDGNGGFVEKLNHGGKNSFDLHRNP